MSEDRRPTTRAGRKLLEWLEHGWPGTTFPEEVVAIEAEAATAERKRIRVAIGTLEVHGDVWWPDDESIDVQLLRLDDVLEVLSGAAGMVDEAVG